MPLAESIRQMPKVELHVHLEGSIRPETLLKLARRNSVDLPAQDMESLREWYRFRDFEHFVQVYLKASSCIQRPEDLELITYEFLQGQAEQNVLHSEVTYTALTIFRQSAIPWADQVAAINRARRSAQSELGVTMELILDIVREVSVEDGQLVADWAIASAGEGVCALGLSGIEVKTEPKKHAEAFRRAKAAGLGISTHAGETHGPQSIWGCLEDLGADRIGHGVRCLDDDSLVDELKDRQTPMEVCPTSNVCLCVAQSIPSHPIQAMITRGLNVSVNSDDPPMFNTTLTDEWLKLTDTFGWGVEQIEDLSLRAARASFAPKERKAELERVMTDFFAR